MTRYTVRTWTAANSALRSALTRASNWVDHNLAVDPERQGRASAVDPAHRSLLVPETGEYAIVVHYQVLAQDRQVEVLFLQHAPNK